MANEILLRLKRLFVRKDAHKDLLHYCLFRDLNANQRRMVSEFLHTREFSAGESVFEEGYPLEVIYFIESGEMEVTPLISDAGPVRLKEHQFIGVLDYFSGKKRLNSAKAVTDLVLKALSDDDLQELLSKDPALGVKLLRACCAFLGGYIRDQVHHHRS